MSFQIFNLLSPQDVAQVTELLANENFADGRATAKGADLTTKNNLQFGRETAQPSAATTFVDTAMRRHEALSAYTVAKAWVPPSFSRYDTGMHYADHIDSGLMRAGQAIIRTDFAMTLFLSPPEAYEGGALVLRSDFGEEEIKLASGQAVVYTCRYLHRVEPVTQGSRLVSLSWIQSHIADDGLRSVANDLKYLLAQAKPEDARSESHQRLCKAYHNLLRSTAQGF
jgi:PKHD-type hydroxylase